MKRQEYDHDKLEGNDVDIEISLKEYGFAWIEADTKFLFYYGIKMEENDCKEAEYVLFDFCSVDKNIDIKEEFDWVEWDSVNSFIGTDIMDCPLTQQYFNLLSYYGYENIFGSWEELDYTDIVKDSK